MIDGLAAAYSATGGAWQRGPGRIYDRVAETVVARSPVSLAGTAVLDVGAGTGAATRAVVRAGAAHVVAVDVAVGMLAHDAAARPPAVGADALSLPFRERAFGAAIAAFSLNHMADPVNGLREMVRVTRPGGPLVVAAYAFDDAHPVKKAVEDALTTRGWKSPPWYAAVRRDAVPLLATTGGAEAVARAAGLRFAVESLRIPFPDLGAMELVAWRLGMAQHAPFVARLEPAAHAELVEDAVTRLGEPPVLERSIVVLTALSV